MKKFILGTVFTSSMFLLGATGHKADAATSSLKDMDKTVTTTKNNVKLYSDSKLKKAKKVDSGKVYDVKGYRIINGKKYYRLYRRDYEGYMQSTDTKDLKAVKIDKNVTYKKDYDRWSSFFFDRKKGTANDKTYYKAKYEYTLGNGRKYYSLYAENSKGKSEWQGYVNVNSLQEVKAVYENKNVRLISNNYDRWTSFYFNGKKGTTQKGKIYNSERYYTLGNGRKYYSLYEVKSDGTKKWAGYVNANAAENMASKNVRDEVKEVKRSTDTWDKTKKKGKVKKGQKVMVKRYYDVNGTKYYSIYNELGKDWLGYISEKDLQDVKAPTKPSEPTKPTEPSKPSDSSDSTTDSSTGNSSTIDSGASTTVDTLTLQNAIKDLEEINKEIPASELDNDGNYSTVLENAKNTLESAKKGKADSEQVNKAVKLVNDFIDGLSLNGSALKEDIEKVKDEADDVYLSNSQKETMKTKLSNLIDRVKKGGKKLANWTNVKEAEEAFEQTQKDLATLPTSKEGEDLARVLDEAEQVSKRSKGNGETPGIVNDEAFKTFLTDYDNAKKVMSELKGTSDDVTAKKVSDAAGKLVHDMNLLTIDTTQAKELIEKAKDNTNDEVQNAKTSLESMIKEPRVSNWEAIAQAQRRLSKALADHPKDSNSSTSESISSLGLDEETVKDSRKLAKAVVESGDASDEAKKLAKTLTAYWAAYDANEQTDGKIPDLENNAALNRSEKDAPAATKDLQKYARDTKSVADSEFQKDQKIMEKDMDDILVSPKNINKAYKDYTDAGGKDTDLENKAKKYVDNGTGETANNRGLENMKDMFDVQKQLEVATKTLKEDATNSSLGLSEQTLKDDRKLAKAVVENLNASADAKKLANTLIAYWAAYDAGSEHVPGLENDRAFTKAWEKDAPEASADLQKYARNTKAVNESELQQDQKTLADDLDNMHVSPKNINKAYKDYLAEVKEAKGDAGKADAKLLEQAKKYVDFGDGSTYNERVLEHWNDMYQVQKQLEEATKKLQQAR